MLRTALIGAGRNVLMGHAPALQGLRDHYQVVAIADRTPDALEHVGVLLGIPPEHRYADYREMLLHEGIDVAIISVPHAYHYEATMACLLSGAHVMTDRPLALSLHDATELLQTAENRGRLISVLHFYLFYPPFQEGIRLVREGAIGQPFLIRCEGVMGGHGAGTESYHPDWHADPEIAGGGVWMDTGYHSAYLCAALMGSPISAVTAQMGTYTLDIPVEDTAAALLLHENGATSSIQAAWSVLSGGQRVFEVYGSEGTLVYDHEGHAIGLFENASRVWRHLDIPVGRAESFSGIFRAVGECLNMGAPPPISHRDAIHTLGVVLAGYQANEQKTVEHLG